MALLTKEFFINNKNKRGSWGLAYLLGTTEDKPLPKTRQEAMYHFLETGELDYLPNDSDTVLNVLTDGLDDYDWMPLQIPDNCK